MKTVGIDSKSIQASQIKEQALNGWIAVDSSLGEVKGSFSGIKVMAGDTASLTLGFRDDKCVTNGLSIDLPEGDYLPTINLISVTVISGKVFLIKS